MNSNIMNVFSKDDAAIRKFYAKSETIPMNETEAKLYFDSNIKNMSEVEGIWESLDGEYRCAVVGDRKDKNHFTGFILNADSVYWMPGQVKFDFQKQKDNRITLYYYMKDHSVVTERNIQFTGDTLYEWNGKWVKKYPATIGLSKGLKINKPKKAEWFQLKNIDDSTLLLSLPSFDPKYKFIVDTILRNNRDKLLNTPYLIIDIRGNGGGGDGTFTNIKPLLYTNPSEIAGNVVLASKENIASFENLFDKVQGNEKAWLISLVKRMKANPGSFVTYFAGGTIRYENILPNPRKIGILINNQCASSSEQFLLYALDSKKVQLFGQPTSGTLDYSNVIPVDCPNPVFKFGHATTRSNRLPNFSVDKEKIKPNVYLTDDVNWIDEAVKQLKKN